MKSAIIILIISIVTAIIRFLPFMIFKSKIPDCITYLGNVLPPAIIGMLVIYCLKDINLTAFSFGIPEFISVLCVAAAQIWKRNSLLSILSGTLIYMVLIQTIF